MKKPGGILLVSVTFLIFLKAPSPIIFTDDGNMIFVSLAVLTSNAFRPILSTPSSSTISSALHAENADDMISLICDGI